MKTSNTVISLCVFLMCVGTQSRLFSSTIEPQLPPPGWPQASHTCRPTCLPGTSVPVTAVFEYSGYLTSFSWQPILPPGWSVLLMGGPNQPVVNADGAIVFPQTIPSSPIRFTYYVRVPADASGTNLLRSRITYRYGIAPQTGEIAQTWATPDPLMLVVRPPLVPQSPWTLVWQHTSGTPSIWQMDGADLLNFSSLSPSGVDPKWRLASAADVNGDGHLELRWQHADGWLANWCLDGTNCTAQSYLNPNRVSSWWRMAASADLNADGQADILWQHTNGCVSVWYMNGTNRVGGGFLNPTNYNPDWKLVATGHFGGNGGVDLLWQHTDGSLAAWFMKGLERQGMTRLNPPQVDPHWKVVATHDLNSDGHTEIIWQHSSGLLVYWVMNGNTRIDSGLLSPDPVPAGWQVVGPR